MFPNRYGELGSTSSAAKTSARWGVPAVRDRIVQGALRHVLEPIFEADFAEHSKANVFAAVDGFVRRRLRSLLHWRSDGRGKGIGEAHHRWPNTWFTQHGLLSLAAEHDWTRTIVRIRTY